MRAMPHLVSAAALALLVAIMPGRAHHAVQAQFDVDQAVEKRGILTKIDWINPHTYMHFDVAEDGVTRKYAIESLGILGLRRAGIDSKSAFKVGELFTFTINPNTTTASDVATTNLTISGDSSKQGHDRLTYQGILNSLGQDSFQLNSSPLTFRICSLKTGSYSTQCPSPSITGWSSLARICDGVRWA